MLFYRHLTTLTAALLVAHAAPAWAQDDESADDSADSSEEESEAIPEDEEAEDEGISESEETLDDDRRNAGSPVEIPRDREPGGIGAREKAGETYHFIGVRYRNQIIPKAIQNIFVEGGETVYSHTPGIEYIIRKDGFEYGLFGMVSFLELNDVPFRGDDDIETVDTDWKIFYIGSDFTLSTEEFARGLSATFGGGVGLGFFAGDMYRTEAYPGPGASGVDGWIPCLGPANPNPVNCETVPNSNGEEPHYNYKEPSWADGGASPLFMPWLAGQVGLRYKLHPKFVMHAELGLNLLPPGVFLGIGADYGL